MIGIYKITSPCGKVYIGQSTDINRRWSQYRFGYKNLDNNTSKLFNSFRKYGIEAHNFQVKEECDINELNNRERYWQEFYDVIENGLNCKFVETDENYGYLSEETKQKISKANKGKPSSMKGKNHTIKTKKKMSESAKNREQNLFGFFGKHTNETKIKMSEAKKGKPAPNRKSVLQIDLDGNIIKEWNSVVEAQTQLNIGGIRNVVTGRAKTSGGFYWKYKN
jgi:group I intron endonuclease